jgi:hypothetical protein
VNRAVSVLCVVAGSIFAVLAALVLFTKLTAPTVRAVLYVAAFGVAAVACYRAAMRSWRHGGREFEQ